ncbi:MAG: DUF4837 family protein [Flavobacteriaceae bacterium]
MKKIACFILLGFTFLSCQNNELVLETSVGDTNQVTIIIEDALWGGEVGDSLRKKLTTSVEGLPQEEPLFSLVQHIDRSGDDDFCKNRNIIIVEKSTEKFFEVRNNDFALNQNVIYLSGRNIPEILDQIEQKSDSVINIIADFEIRETQQKIALSPLDTQNIQSKLGVTLNIPHEFEYVAEDKKFVWLKKENQNGSSNLLIYQIPYFEYESQSENIRRIIKVRDSVGECYVQSQEDKKHAYMITERAYTPYFTTTTLADKKAFQTKGTWELKGIFMSGPFLNYAISDKENNRILVLEGFVYAPSSSKRNMIHELEAIIKSVKID